MSTLYRISLVILTCYYVSACYAANYIWDGGGGDDNWSTSGNWSPDGTPNSSDIAIFDGTSDSNSTVDSGFTTSIGGIRMGPNYDGTVTLATPLGVSGSVVISGGTLDVSTSNYLLEAEGDFIVYGDGTFNARSGTVRLSGTGDESLQIDGSSLENLILNTAESGLVGWWKFDEVSGGTFADSSGNGNSGTGYGSSGVNNTPEPSIETPSTIRFRNPRSLDFDGTDDRVVVADTTPFDFAGEDTPFTLSLWVQLDSTGQQRLINKQRNVTNEFLFGIRVNSSSQFDFNIAKQNIAATRVTDPSTAETGKWYHLVGVSDGNEIAFYVNGELVDGPDTITISNANQTVADLNIGRFYNATQYTNGRIDDVRIYNRDLSANEIATLSSGKYGPSASSYTLGATLDVDGALHILNGTLNVSGGNYGISVAGDWYNAGSFESQNGTVTLNGTNQTLSGSTAFYNLTKTVASPATLTLDANGIHTVSGALNLMGASSNLLSLRSSTNGNEAYFYVDNDASDPALQYLNVQDMHSGSGATMECLTGSYECVNSGNNTNWVFAPTIAVTGTVYTDQGITDIGAGKTVALSVNGASAADTDDTDSNGFYSVSAAINVGDVLTLYLDDEAEDAVTVTVSSGSMMSGVHLYQNRLILKNETGGIITTTHLQTSDDNADNDVTELYSFNSNDLEVAKDTELYIWTNSTFTTDGRVTGHDTEIVGSLEMGSNTLVLSGSLVASSGTLETSGNLILMDTETTEILQLGSNAVHNIHIGSGSTASYAAVENGLTGAYYTGMNFDSLASTVVDSTVNFNPFDSTLQTRTGQSNTTSTRWTGYVKADTTDTYTFRTYSDDGVRLYVDDSLIIDNWTNHAPTYNTGDYSMTADTWYSLQMDHYENTGGATAVLQYKTSAGSYGVIASDNLATALVGVEQQKPGHYILGSDLNIDGSLIIHSGSLLDASATHYNITIGGDLTNETSGSGIVARQNTITFDGSGNQTVSGANLFYNWKVTTSSARTLYFDAGGLQSVSGALTLQGQDGNLLSIRSTPSSSSGQLLLDSDSGTQTVRYLDVSSNNANGGLTILCDRACVDSGNTQNWDFTENSGANNFFHFFDF